MSRSRVPLSLVLSACLLCLIAAITAGIAFGSVRIPAGQVWATLWAHLQGHSRSGVYDAIVWQIRAPRVALAVVVGAGLSVAGAVVQTLVRNSLADPYLLGVSSGASVGAALVLLFGALATLGLWSLSVGAVSGASVASLTVFVLAQRGGRLAPTQLLLTGVVLAAMFSAVTSFLIFKANPLATQAVLFWLLGSFGNASWPQVPLPSLLLLAALIMLMSRAKLMNALALGPEVATSVGVRVGRLRVELFVLVALVSGMCVALSGVIGFVGLVVPHIVRVLVGSDHQRVLPTAALFGAAFTVLGDLLARTLVAPQEMPMGVITAFIGAPTLLWLMRRRPQAYGASE